jgi:RNA recognition motif-containing protein
MNKGSNSCSMTNVFPMISFILATLRIVRARMETNSSWIFLMSIYVGNLSYEVTQEDLTSTFAEYGSVKRVQLPTDRETGRMRGFAFVEMGSDAEEEKAISELDGAEWMGRALKVNKAKPREDNRGGGGSFGGGGGGRRY